MSSNTYASNTSALSPLKWPLTPRPLTSGEGKGLEFWDSKKASAIPVCPTLGRDRLPAGRQEC